MQPRVTPRRVFHHRGARARPCRASARRGQGAAQRRV